MDGMAAGPPLPDAPPTDVTASQRLQETLARLHSLQRRVQALEGQLRDRQPELQALHAADTAPPPVPASALPPFQSLEAPAQGSPWREVGPNQLVVPHGGGEAVVWVRQATAEAAADATAKCVDALDGGQLPLLPASDEHQLISFGGNRKALSDGTCQLYPQYQTSRGAAQHEFGKGLSLALYLLLCDYFPDHMLAEAEALPLAAWRACMRHGGYRMPFTQFSVAKDQVSRVHRHSDERVGSLFIGMAGDGEQPRHYALVLRGLRVWIRLRPGLIIRFNASQLEHAVMYDFQTEPPPASELEGKQHVYALAMVLKGGAMTSAAELAEAALTGAASDNKFREPARAMQGLVSDADPSRASASARDLLQQMHTSEQQLASAGGE